MSGAAGEDGAVPADRIRWRAATLGVVVIAVTIFPTFLTGALSVQIGDDLGVNLAGVGGLYAVFFAVSAFASAPTGRFVQAIGWRWGIRLASGSTGLALLAMAALPRPWWSAWWPVAMVFAAGGVAGAVSQAGSNLALAESVPRSRYGLVFGLKHTAVPAAAMLGGLAVPTIALTVGWRWAYVAAACLAFATLATVPSGGPARPARHGPLEKAARPTTPVPVLAVIAVAAALAHTGLDSLTVVVVPYAVDSGVAEGTAGLLLTLGSIASMVMRIVSGLVVDRRQHTGMVWMAGLMLTGGVGFCLLALGSVPLALALLVAFLGAWGWAGLLTFVVVRANPGAPATATGIANTGKYVGAAAGPVLAGYLADSVSFSAAFWMAGITLIAAAVIVAAIRATPAGAAIADPPRRPS